MDFHTFLLHVREYFREPVHWPTCHGWKVTLLEGILLCLPAYVLARSSVSPQVLVGTGSLSTLAFLMYRRLRPSKSSSPETTGLPLPAREMAFTRNVISVLCLTYVLVFSTLNLLSEHFLGLFNRFYLLFYPTFVLVYIVMVVESMHCYRALREQHV
ncbi:MAG TPA: hypothetical protein VGL77_16025 [Armatimonadota bacterium]